MNVGIRNLLDLVLGISFESRRLAIIMSSILGSLVSFYLIRKIFNRPKTWLKPNVENKVIIMTGASDGIGKEAALELLKNGAKVIFACRNEEKTENILSKITDEKQRKNAFYIELDLSSFSSIKNFVKKFTAKFQTLDILVNNAGVINRSYELTADNIEATLQINTFSPMILTMLLKNHLLASNGKVINLTGKLFYLSKNKQKEYFENAFNTLRKEKDNNEGVSYISSYDFQKSGFSGFSQYAFSKLGNVYFTLYLDKINVKAAVVHPGVIETNISHQFKGIFWSLIRLLTKPLHLLFSKSIFMGAQTILHLCYAEGTEFKSGEYYEDNKPCELKEWVKDNANVNAFMLFAKQIINYYGNKNEVEIHI